MLSHTVGIFSVDVWILLMIFRSFVSFVRSFVDGRRRRTRARHSTARARRRAAIATTLSCASTAMTRPASSRVVVVVARARATKCAPTPRSLRRRRRASSCASSCRTIICDGRGCDSRERVIPRRRCRWTCTGRDGRGEMVEARMSWRGGRRNDRVGDDAIEARMERRKKAGV